MVYIWNLDPVAFSLLGLDVRWYGLVYALGALFGIWYGDKLQKKIFPDPVKKDAFENLILGMFFCGILGGRVFEMFVYELPRLLNDPTELFRIWNGGMSIHGGLIGGAMFLYYWARKHKVPVLSIMDTVVLPLSIVMIFGRMANFVNGELWGMPTGADWGVIFPHVDEILRHPSSLYEAAQNLLTSLVLAYGIYKTAWYKHKGMLTAVFLIMYGVIRTGIQIWFREPTTLFFGLSIGMLLSIGMVLIGVRMIVRQKK